MTVSPPLSITTSTPTFGENSPTRVPYRVDNIPRSQLKGRNVSHNATHETSGADSGGQQGQLLVNVAIDSSTQISYPSGEEEPSLDHPAKIVSDTRKKFQEAVRNGSDEDGIDVLEGGLEELRKKSARESGIWQAEILLDLGRKDEARKALSLNDPQLQDQEKAVPGRPPTLRSHSTASDARFEEEMLKLNNQKDQQDQEEVLKIALRAEDWVKATDAAKELHHMDPKFFDIETKMDRYRKCRQLLMLGGLAETRTPQPDHGKALRLYNHGCLAIELFHRHFDQHRTQVNGFDHDDSANLFFSAARVCVFFHENGIADPQGRNLTPSQFTALFKLDPLPCSPPLTEKDWMHQALHFMEQGRSRALLESILREDTETQKKYLMAEIANIASKTHQIEKRRERALQTERDILAMEARIEQSYTLLGLAQEASPIRSVSPTSLETLAQQDTETPTTLLFLDTTTLEDYQSGPSTIPTPSKVESDTSASVLAKPKARMRWQKALVYALATSNPTLNAGLPNSSSIRDVTSIIAKIPPDTAVIEYALVTAPPEGLISIVITADGIQKCIWQKLDTVKIQYDIADLLKSIRSSAGATRNCRPLSPKKRPPRNSKELLRELSSILIQPIASEFASPAITKLIITPSGELAHIPWSLLVDLPVAVIPSLSIWDRLDSRTHEAAPSGGLSVSVVGNPPKNKDGTLKDKDIPWSYIEAFHIAHAHGGVPFLAGESNRTQFQEWVATTRVLHLCTHSTFDHLDPASSGIQIFQRPLTILDWYHLGIKADLVVFSSCLSGLAKVFISGSAFGFAHALLRGGTRAFIGSLWPVDDQATLLLMMLFYHELQTYAPAEALHVAQMQMRGLTRVDVLDLAYRLEESLTHASCVRFVDRPRYWLKRLEGITEEDLEYLRKPECWAAFVLTGYGFRRI